MWGDHSQSGCGIAGSLPVFRGGSLTQPACVSTVPAVSTSQQLILLVWDQGWNTAFCFGSRESLRDGLPTSSTSQFVFLLKMTSDFNTWKSTECDKNSAAVTTELRQV